MFGLGMCIRAIVIFQTPSLWHLTTRLNSRSWVIGRSLWQQLWVQALLGFNTRVSCCTSWAWHICNAGCQACSLEEVDGSLQSEVMLHRINSLPNISLEPTPLILEVSCSTDQANQDAQSQAGVGPNIVQPSLCNHWWSAFCFLWSLWRNRLAHGTYTAICSRAMPRLWEASPGTMNFLEPSACIFLVQKRNTYHFI